MFKTSYAGKDHWAASSIPSLKGKKASEARYEPIERPSDFLIAIRTESTRLICPAPTPTVCLFLVKTMAFDFTCLATFQANKSSSNSSLFGSLLNLPPLSDGDSFSVLRYLGPHLQNQEPELPPQKGFH